MGFDPAMFKQVMTSGEALWQDIKSSQITETSFYVIERANGDAQSWAEGLDITLTSIECAEAVLLMGLADDADKESLQPVMDLALESELPVYCSNPDRVSPRAEGLVMSPGALAHTHQERGGRVVFYGKPHRAVFDALQTELSAERLLMVGDSLEHDICGAHAAGWDSVFVTEGIYAREFANAPFDETLSRLAKGKMQCVTNIFNRVFSMTDTHTALLSPEFKALSASLDLNPLLVQGAGRERSMCVILQ